MSTARRAPLTFRRAGALAAAVVGAVVLAACGSDEDPSASRADSSTSSAEESAASGTGEEDPADPGSSDPAAGAGGAGSGSSALAAGLLPAESFGSDATVVDVPEEQLRAGAGLSATDGDVQISPSSCAQAVDGTQPQIAENAEVAAVSATTGGTTTVEVLMRGGDGGSVEQLRKAAASCPKAQISSPEIGTATLTFEKVTVPDLGDGAAALKYTTTVSQDGSELSVPALVGVVEDGERTVTLLTLSTDGSAPDVAEFTTLLEQAFQVQADELG